jgi:hypothetical protein
MTVKIGNWFPILTFGAKSKQEINSMLDACFERGITSPFYVKGKFVSHLGVDIFTPLGLCGLVGKSTSSNQPVTVFGAICPVCKSRYAARLHVFMTGRMRALDEAKRKADIAGEEFKQHETTDELRELMKSPSKLFNLMKN